jgi:hypothetical protein
MGSTSSKSCTALGSALQGAAMAASRLEGRPTSEVLLGHRNQWSLALTKGDMTRAESSSRRYPLSILGGTLET